MKRFICVFASAAVLIAFAGCNKSAATTSAPVKLATHSDTVSYLIGNDIARSLKGMKDDIVLDVIFAGIRDGVAGGDPRISEDVERKVMTAFSGKMREKQMAQKNADAQANLEEAKKFLEENGKKEGVVTTESGLQYTVLTEGDGPIPADTSRVKVHYEGKLLDGKVFDSSIKRGEPTVFGVNQVIKGWTEALKLMKVGSKYKVFIPPELAYGPRGAGRDIGPNKLLIFEVELLGIEK